MSDHNNLVQVKAHGIEQLLPFLWVKVADNE